MFVLNNAMLLLIVVLIVYQNSYLEDGDVHWRIMAYFSFEIFYDVMATTNRYWALQRSSIYIGLLLFGLYFDFTISHLWGDPPTLVLYISLLSCRLFFFLLEVGIDIGIDTEIHNDMVHLDRALEQRERENGQGLKQGLRGQGQGERYGVSMSSGTGTETDADTDMDMDAETNTAANAMDISDHSPTNCCGYADASSVCTVAGWIAMVDYLFDAQYAKYLDINSIIFQTCENENKTISAGFYKGSINAWGSLSIFTPNIFTNGDEVIDSFCGGVVPLRALYIVPTLLLSPLIFALFIFVCVGMGLVLTTKFVVTRCMRCFHQMQRHAGRVGGGDDENDSLWDYCSEMGHF